MSKLSPKTRRVRAWVLLNADGNPMMICLGEANANYEAGLYNAKYVKRCKVEYTLPKPKRGRQ